MYRQLLIKQPKDDISMQLKELLTNNMFLALFPNLYNWQTYACQFPFQQHQRNQVSQI